MREDQSATPTRKISQDSLFDRDLICCQHQEGYRFSIDSVLLAHFVSVRHGDAVLDLGAGSGIIGMILLYRWREKIRHLTGIEFQQELAELAGHNARANGLDRLLEIIRGDVKKINTLVAAEAYDAVVCNPPFYAAASGRLNRNQQAQRARHQILGNLQDFLVASSFAVKNGGNVFYIYPAERCSEFISLAEATHLGVKKLRFVYSYPDAAESARLILVKCCKNGGSGTEVLPPLYIYQEKNGEYSPEVEQYYRKNGFQI